MPVPSLLSPFEEVEDPSPQDAAAQFVFSFVSRPGPTAPANGLLLPPPNGLLLPTFRLGLLTTVNEIQTLLTDLSKAHLLGKLVLGPIKVIVSINHQTPQDLALLMET